MIKMMWQQSILVVFICVLLSSSCKSQDVFSSVKLNLCSSFNVIENRLNNANLILSDTDLSIELPATVMSNNVNTTFRAQRNIDEIHCTNPISVSAQTLLEVHNPKLQFQSNGELILGINNFRPQDYCFASLDNSSLTIKACNPCFDRNNADSSIFCIPKCCNANSVFSSHKCTRTSTTDIWSQKESPIEIHDGSAVECFDVADDKSGQNLETCLTQSKIPEVERLFYYYTKDHFTCTSPTVHSYRTDRFAMLGNGSVILHLDNQKLLVLNNEFCLDYELYRDKLNPVLWACYLENELETADPAAGTSEDEVEIGHGHGIPKGIQAGTVLMRKCPNVNILPDVVTVSGHLMSTGQDTWFRLNETVQLQCPHTKSATIDFTDGLIHNPTASEEDEALVKQFTPAGVLLIDGEFFQPFQYCLQGFSEPESNLTLDLCDFSFSCNEGEITCIKKCCAWDEYLFSYSMNESVHCGPRKQFHWSPNVFHENGSALAQREIHFMKGALCPGQHYSTTENLRTFEVLENGSIRMKTEDGNEVTILKEEFCLDGQIIDGTIQAEVLIHCDSDGEEEAEQAFEIGVSAIYVSAMLISSFFLLLTLIVYTLIWDKHNVHGWTVYGYAVAMFFLLIFFITAHLINLTRGNEYHIEHSSTCQAVALLIHFFFLSTFCWLTALNFDLWWTFRSLTPTTNKSQGFGRLFHYIGICAGAPLVVVIIALILDKTLPEDTSAIRPDYGKLHCTLSHDGQGPYLIYIIGALLLVNLVFFANTIYVMYQYQQNSRAVRRKTPKNQSQVQLFAKLFLIMGVGWIFEVISWKTSDKGRNSHWAWLFIDLFNLLQGLFIFIIFVLKKQVLSHLWNKYPNQRRLLGPLRRLCKVTTMEIDSREVSGTRMTSMSNSATLKQYTVNPKGSTLTRTSSLSTDSAL